MICVFYKRTFFLLRLAGRSTETGRFFSICSVFLSAALLMCACGESIERSSARGMEGPKSAVGGDKKKSEAKAEMRLSYGDEEFVESETNRDPFRSFTGLLQIQEPQEPQRKVVLPTTAIEEMKLIAIISGVPSPKAMVVDAGGVGHVIERGMFIGRPQVVRASENVLMTLNWKVDRIRSNEVVLTRKDPNDPARPPLTRVITLREEGGKPR